MNALFTVLSICVILAAILLTLVVLLQNGKGGGLASNFVAGNQTFGVRQTADMLEKITWGLACFILLFSIVTNFISHPKEQDTMDITSSIQEEQAEQAPEFPVSPATTEETAE